MNMTPISREILMRRQKMRIETELQKKNIDLVSILDRETEKKIKLYPHPNNRASEAGHPCLRFLVASRLYPEKKALHDISLQRIFEEGNLHEEDVLRKLDRAGIKVIEQQRPFEWRELQLAGRIDGKLKINGLIVPLEIKSCSPNVFHSIKELEQTEFLKSKYSWVRKYPAQIMLYCLMDGKEFGIILFKNKVTGELVQKTFYLDYEYIESILQKLEKVNEYVARGELPEVQECDDCKRCDFSRTICFPNQDYGPGFSIMSDEELEAKLERWHELKEAAKEYEELDKELKEMFKGKMAIVGNFKIESKEYTTTRYNVPKEIKSQFAEKQTYYRTTIERIGG